MQNQEPSLYKIKLSKTPFCTFCSIRSKTELCVYDLFPKEPQRMENLRVLCKDCRAALLDLLARKVIALDTYKIPATRYEFCRTAVRKHRGIQGVVPQKDQQTLLTHQNT